MPLVYSDWARLVSLTAGIWTLWGGCWGIFFRKFFFDGLGGKLGPKGIIPPPSAAIFIYIIVSLPVLQFIAIANGILLLAIDWPLPFVNQTILGRSRILKAALLFWNGLVAMMIYQTFDAFLISFIACGIYIKAHMKGEGKENQAGQAGKGAKSGEV